MVLVLSVEAGAQKQPDPAPQPAVEKIVKLYPNPAVNYIIIDLRGYFKQGLTLQIIKGMMGTRMFSGTLSQEQVQLNLTDYPRGLYVYRLLDSSGQMIASGKFQVSK